MNPQQETLVLLTLGQRGTIPGSQSSWGPRRLLLAGLCEAASSQAVRFRAELGAGAPWHFLTSTCHFGSTVQTKWHLVRALLAMQWETVCPTLAAPCPTSPLDPV